MAKPDDNVLLVLAVTGNDTKATEAQISGMVQTTPFLALTQWTQPLLNFSCCPCSSDDRWLGVVVFKLTQV